MNNNVPDKDTPLDIIKTIIIVVLIIVVFLVLKSYFFSGSSPFTPKIKDEQSKQIDALIYSQSAVKDNLVAPLTAKFPGITDDKVSVEKITENNYFVTAYVDSENNFSAMIRSYYTCTVIIETDQYIVKDIKFIK
jgi:hypothetical protein